MWLGRSLDFHIRVYAAAFTTTTTMAINYNFTKRKKKKKKRKWLRTNGGESSGGVHVQASANQITSSSHRMSALCTNPTQIFELAPPTFRTIIIILFVLFLSRCVATFIINKQQK